MELLVERLVRRGLEVRRWLDVERGEPADVRIVREDSPANRGYVRAVAHLVKVEEID